ncbi:putative inorganic phosphate cotransporter isoform X2 [Cephus cinctus]|uniref:Putative inorganic phosphate cotransporter n=1 Tax=Cephus cinctus TaxID=211228 RepID=A0AAJ7FL90_CEPCN|nr:putative inorganic phosphate cotransporter isoform X2 [Cephus cinctus]
MKSLADDTKIPIPRTEYMKVEPEDLEGKIGTRHWQIFLMFLGMVMAYALRVNMSVTIVAMADSSSANIDFETYDWNEWTKSIILSSFFWGYTIMQLPSGYLAQHWSAQRLLSTGMFICSILNMLVPLAAKYGDWGAVCACRVGMGLSQACLMPSLHTMLSKWVPPTERARLGTFAYAGAQFGTVIAMPISGYLAASSIGWPSVFYVFGTVSLLWTILFYICGADSPAQSKMISFDEKKFIQDSFNAESTKSEEKHVTPWVNICTSMPMWAIIIAHCGQSWGFWMLLTEIPSYMNAILSFDIKKNGLMSALPYLTMWLLSFPISWCSDYALKKGATRSLVRKISNTIANWGPAAALVALCFAPADNVVLVMIILFFAVGLSAASACGFLINHIDLSPNNAGSMIAITNCVAAVVAIVSPLIAGVIITDENNVSQWHIVFYLTAAIYFINNLIFIIFGRGEVQWWNDPSAKKPLK